MFHPINIHQEFAAFFNDKNLESAAYAVSLKLSEGHTCVHIEDFNAELKGEANEDPLLQTIDTDTLLKSSFVSKDTSPIQPFILNQGYLYLQRYFAYETEIIDHIKSLITEGNKHGEDNEKTLLKHKAFILSLFADHTVIAEAKEEENINWQLIAALTAILSHFSIITGGPGTGKTTAVAKLLALLFTINPDTKVALAAPTGKAAARMKESLMSAVIRNKEGEEQLIRSLNIDMLRFDTLNASTLHRLLGYRPGTHYFKHDAHNPLDYDVVIVDESSMIGASMMAKLLQAIKPTSRLIMLGDKDQLASVEAGSIFGDICLTQKEIMNTISPDKLKLFNRFITEKSAKLSPPYSSKNTAQNILQEHIIELKKSWRFKSTEGIGEFSHAVLHNTLTDELINREAPTTGQYVKVCNDYAAVELNDLMEAYKAYIQEKDIALALAKMNKVRFLCAVRSGNYGVRHYNELIASYLAKEGLLQPKATFYENQPIMITKNDKEHQLFNGDIGLIRKEKSTDRYMAYFENGESGTGYRALSTTYLSEYTTVFAMTIHKSQGSEFNHVGIVLPNDENTPLLTRELIYTAITRAKERAIIFSSNAVLKAGIDKQVERASGITKRFLHTLN